MLRQAERDLAIDLPRSYVVGDRWTDVATAQAVGASGILVRTGYGAQEAATPPVDVRAAAIVAHLLDAATWIVQRTGTS
jgi:D-glycero-D-manno-heptose 1,7-bisphosphate phosphatase